MRKKNARIVFMGTPEIAATVFEALIINGYNIVGLIAQPDREIGRKRVLTPVPTKIVAEKYQIPTYQPVSLKKEFQFLIDLKPDLIITLAYGQIVSQEVLDIPTLGCINLHGSLLPKYRGAAPMQYALFNNDKVTGFSLMRMIKAMDAGVVYKTKKLTISDDDNYSSLYEKMAVCAKDLILESLPEFLHGCLIGKPQDESKVTFCPSIKPEEEQLNLSENITSIIGKIRGLSYVPGAYLFINEEKVKIFKAKIVSFEAKNHINEVIKADKDGLFIQLSSGVLSVLELQKVGKNRMCYKDFINGNRYLLGKKVA